MNKLLAINSTENKSGGLLLVPIFICVSISFLFLWLIIDDPQFQFKSLLLVILILLASTSIVCYLLDEFLWQLIGEETLIYNKSCLIIKHSKRLFNRKVSIKWECISHIRVYRSRMDFLSYFSMAGVSQYTIQIRSLLGRTIKCGVNLNEYQRDALIRQIEQLHDLYANTAPAISNELLQ